MSSVGKERVQESNAVGKSELPHSLFPPGSFPQSVLVVPGLVPREKDQRGICTALWGPERTGVLAAQENSCSLIIFLPSEQVSVMLVLSSW